MNSGIYRKKKVLSLNENALNTFANVLARTLESIERKEKEEEVIRELKHYIESTISVPSKINEELLSIVFSSDILYPVQMSCLEILLNPGVKNFKNSYYIWETEFWHIFSKQCQGLRVSHFDKVLLPEKYVHLFYDIIKKSAGLISLSLPQACLKKTLNAVAKYCPKLRFLKIPDFHDTIEGISFLRNNLFAEMLTQLDLSGMFNFSCEEVYCSIAELLNNCPNLEAISGFAYTSKVIEICQKYDENFKCNLKYVSDIYTSTSAMQIIIDTCPKMVALDLIVPYTGVLKVLEGTSLQKLSLNTFIPLELISLLDKIGHQLLCLELRQGNEAINIADIAHRCPFLISASFNFVHIVTLDNINCNFGNLEKIIIRNSYLTDLDFKLIICSSASLKILDIDNLLINDECLKTTHIFTKLEEFFIGEAPELTIASVQMLLLECPNLKKIGNFYGWDISFRDTKSVTCLEGCVEEE